MRDARKDGQDAADDAQTTGLLLQGVLRTMPAVLGSPGLPSEAQLGEQAGNVPKPQPQNVPISEMQPPKDWAPWKKALFEVGRGEATALAGTVSLAKKAYDDPEIDPGRARRARVADLPRPARHREGARGLRRSRERAPVRLGRRDGPVGPERRRGDDPVARLAAHSRDRVAEHRASRPDTVPDQQPQVRGDEDGLQQARLRRTPRHRRPQHPESRRLELAQKYPNGVRFARAGYPVFTPEAVKRVHVDGMTGDYTHDADLANQAIRTTSTPEDYVWHHVEDGKTMELVPRDLHRAASHSGGATAIKNTQVGQVRPGGVFTPFERGGAIGGGAAGFAVPAGASGGQ